MARALGTIAFTAAGLSPTYDAYARALEARIADSVNIVDFGAVADYVPGVGGATGTGTDNTAAIQAAINEAMPNTGTSGAFNARPMFIPPGNFGIAGTLYIQGVKGGLIHGAGMGTSTITYMGSATAGNAWGSPLVGDGSYANWTPVFMGEAANFCKFENFAVEGTTTNRTASGSTTMGFFFISPPDLKAGVTAAGFITTQCMFENMKFANFRLDGMYPGTGHNAENFVFTNCVIDQCDRGGIFAGNQNSLNHIFIGGKVTNCGHVDGAWVVGSGSDTGLAGGLVGATGSFLSISGTWFENNHLDIGQKQAAVNVFGCLSMGGPEQVASIGIAGASAFVTGHTFFGESTACMLSVNGGNVHLTSSLYDPHIHSTGLPGNSGAGFIVASSNGAVTIDNLVVTANARSGGSFNTGVTAHTAFSPIVCRNCDFDGSPFPPTYGTHAVPFADIKCAPFTIATLPPADAAYAGIKAVVRDYTNSGTPTFWSTTLTPGGTRYLPVICDGAAWRIGG